MDTTVQIAQIVSAVGLLVTLIVVVWYTVATDSMAKATRAMADTQREEIDLRKRPVVQVMAQAPETIVMDGRPHVMGQRFQFRTRIANVSNVHAKVRVKASVLFAGRRLELPADGLYNGNRTLEIQAGTGIDGHLDFENLFPANGIPTEKIPVSVPFGAERQLRVKLESCAIYYYDSDDKFDCELSKNPAVYYYWSGTHEINARGKWIPDYDVRDFEESRPE